ncbi:PDZ domain-containing protein 11 [Intoshia linei]|uniref:PDZ domain-containing protein 11 n=1 Tax=Intoshia linei TaxID=1819745 RepID=A0A177B9X2_9BILA|nr:PDZ domain-containing protein 11 [Intoshia linei]
METKYFNMEENLDSKDFNLKEDIDKVVSLIRGLKDEGLNQQEKEEYTDLINLEKILESDLFNSVRQVYELMYNTVDIKRDEETRAIATEKFINLSIIIIESIMDGCFMATIAAFAASQMYSHPRLVTIKRSNDNLGFNITGGSEQNSPIFISRIIPNSCADISAELRRGDQIISINGINVENVSHSKAVELFKGPETTFVLMVQYLPKVLDQIEKQFDD